MNFWQKLPAPFTVLAPMEGVTDAVFRELISQTTRPHVFFTEFTNVEAVLTYNKFAQRSLMYTKNQRPIVAQIWGVDPIKFSLAAKKIADLGFDGIDINLGCPVRDIIKKGACSAMIGKTIEVSQIITAVKESGLPVSVKTRLGFDRIITNEWVSFLLGQKIAALTLHGRTARQMSKGEANWAEIGKAVQIRNQLKVNTRIIGNGDIKNYSQILEMHQTYGIDGVMIGRGVLDNPWIFDPTQPPHTTLDHLDLLKKHLEMFEQIYGNTGHYETLKKYFKIYIRDFPGSKTLRIKLMETKSKQQTVLLLDKFYPNTRR